MNMFKSICILCVVCAFVSCKKSETTSATNTPKPVPTFTNTVVGSLPITAYFTNTSGIHAGSVYTWNFGDGSATSSVVSPSHAYTSNGTYPVVLTQTYPGGSSTMSLNIEIKSSELGSYSIGGGASGGAGYSCNIPTKAPYIATFTNNSTNASSYLWTFGDGSSGTNSGISFTHIYTTGGNYTVNLTATGSGGSESTSVVLNLP